MHCRSCSCHRLMVTEFLESTAKAPFRQAFINSPTELAREIDFIGLHNISKQSIYLSESVTAFLGIIDRMTATIEMYASKNENLLPSHQLMLYHRSAVHLIQIRLTSLDRRINNLIGLSFNLVTRSDSRTLKVDSKLMILIALVTMIFLPTNTIASIFSGPFFEAHFQASTGDASTDRLFMLTQFWLFWAISVPITGVILCFGWWYFRSVKKEVLRVHGT